jgi:membrane protein YdbS with pleckstrin-like domain
MPAGVHLPSPSFWPLASAFAMPVIGYGVLHHNWWLIALGAVIVVVTFTGWALEPSVAEE